MSVRIIEARAVISATDKTGGVLKAIGDRLKALGRTSTAVNDTVGRVSAASAAQARGAAAASVAQACGAAIAQAGLSARNRARADAVASRLPPPGRVARPEGGLREGLREYAGHAGAYLAGGLTGVGAYEVARRTVAAQAAQGHELVRMSSSGMDPHEILDARLKASDLSKSNTPFDQTAVMHMLRNARSIVGSYEEAAQIMTPMLKLRTVALGANPHKAGELSADFDKLIKGMEIAGVTQDLPKFTKYMDGMAKAINMFGDTLRPTDYYEMFKYGRQATTNLSEEYMNMVAPTLAQELGGASAGTAHAAFFRAIVGGKMSNLATNELDKLGLLDPSKVVRTKTNNVKGVAPGGIMGSRLAAENPFEWVQQYLMPALKKAGITDPHDQQERIARMFSNQVAAQLVGLFATQQPRFRKDAALTRGAKGLAAADDIARTDPFVALESLGAQARHLASALGTMEAAARAMSSLADKMGQVANVWERQNAGKLPPSTGVSPEALETLNRNYGLPPTSVLDRTNPELARAIRDKEMRDGIDNRKAAIEKQLAEGQAAVDSMDAADRGPLGIVGRVGRGMQRKKILEQRQKLEQERDSYDTELEGISAGNAQLGEYERRLRGYTDARMRATQALNPLGIGFGGGRSSFGFGPNGATGSAENVGEDKSKGGPSGDTWPTRLSQLVPTNASLKDILGGSEVKAELTGSANVEGKATVDVTVKVDASGLGEAITSRVVAMVGKLNAGGGNGPGSTGRSSPDAGTGSGSP